MILKKPKITKTTIQGGQSISDTFQPLKTHQELQIAETSSQF